MPVSLDSKRPILSNEKGSSKSSPRISTYSKTPSTPSETSQMSLAAGTADAADFQGYTTSLDRMADKRLQDQRYTITAEQESEMSKLALAGKVQKALERRYQNQDAVMKPKKIPEKA